MRITYVGHSTVEIAGPGYRLLTDPVLRPRLLHLRRLVPVPSIGPLRHPDAVLISHAHFDHLDAGSLRLVQPRRIVVPRGCGIHLRRTGFTDVTELAPGDGLRIGDAEITATLLNHDGRRHPLSRARETLGYRVEGDASCFVAGDTGPSTEVAGLAGGVGAALLPIWGWGGGLGPTHMGPAEAAQMAAQLQPRMAIPIHWGTLASPRAPWVDDPDLPAREFADSMAVTAPEVDVRIVPPGGHTDVTPE